MIFKVINIISSANYVHRRFFAESTMDFSGSW